ncbi:MAG TPA: hypothetical protein VJ249_03865 [Candidatus Bathyarchaeia archaeon]|nr:hypothetical protein [Candidatus Bathyarchaeia archaeon]
MTDYWNRERRVREWTLENGRYWLFPVSKYLAWWLTSKATEGRLYPHYFRLNRATQFAKHEKTSLDLKKWY